MKAKFMKPNELNKLSREYVIIHEELNILSWDYVIEYGTYFDCEEICWDECYGHYKCDRDGVLFSGLLFELYDNDNLAYYSFHENGLRNGIEVRFYLSGKIESYCEYGKGRIVGRYYEWFENGMIKEFIDHYNNDHHYIYLEADEQGKIVKQGKV